MRILIRRGKVKVTEREKPGCRIESDGSMVDGELHDLRNAVDHAMYISDRTREAPPCALCGGSVRVSRKPILGGRPYEASCTRCGVCTRPCLTIIMALDEWKRLMTKMCKKEVEE